MRREASVNELSRVKERWSLMVDTSIEASRWVVLGNISLEVDWEIWALGKIVDIDRVEIVPSGWSSLGNTDLSLINVGLRSKVKRIGGRIDHSCCCYAYQRVEIRTTIQISCQEWNM
jgi:hypothetical protein